MPTLVGNEHLFHTFFLSKNASFPSLGRKWTDLIRRKWTSKCLFPLRQLCTHTLMDIPYLENLYISNQDIEIEEN